MFLQAFQNLPETKNCIKFADIFAKVMHVMCQLGYCTVSRLCFGLMQLMNEQTQNNRPAEKPFLENVYSELKKLIP